MSRLVVWTTSLDGIMVNIERGRRRFGLCAHLLDFLRLHCLHSI